MNIKTKIPRLGQEITGLTSEEVAKRIVAGQVNTLPARSGRTTLDIIRSNVFTRINAILSVLCIIVLSTGEWIQASFAMLIILNSAIGIVQELRAKRTLDSLALLGESHPKVRRDGETIEINQDELVLDDIIELSPGDQLLVDGEIIAQEYLEIDESLLTGEADPEPKETGAKVLSGSFVVAGSGLYKATKIGADSYAAQLTTKASKFSLVNSELQNGINQVLKFITWLLIPVGIATIYVQLFLTDKSWQDAVLRMSGALVPMVPEGLILLTSMAFALGVIRLGQRNCLVQQLPAIECLARVDVVCADKTGTLTDNYMTLGKIELFDENSAEQAREVLRQLANSDPTPNASLTAIGVGLGKPDSDWQPIARTPFTSAKKWSGISFKDHGNWVLGAPEVLANETVLAKAEKISSSGLRVLLLGKSDELLDNIDNPSNVESVSLVILEQTIRPDAKRTLNYFKAQHMETKVISGDNALSVGAVTKKLGLNMGEPVDARTLPQDISELAEIAETHSVFGRVTPSQKNDLVKALQSKGHMVAMTGDGVNDVLALKQADLGVAMGSGSSATRAVAKIVLLDDKFASLPKVVAEGRRIIGNIERVSKLFLTKTVYSTILALLAVILRVRYPFMPINVSLIGWFTIGIPAFFLSLAPNNEKARSGFVSRVMSIGLPAGIICGFVSFSSYYITYEREATEVIQRQASTTALIALILTSTWFLATVARPYQWWRLGLVLMAIAAYAFLFINPWTKDILTIDISDIHKVQIGLIAGFIGMCCIEILWWIGNYIRKDKCLIWAPKA